MRKFAGCAEGNTMVVAWDGKATIMDYANIIKSYNYGGD